METICSKGLGKLRVRMRSKLFQWRLLAILRIKSREDGIEACYGTFFVAIGKLAGPERLTVWFQRY